MIKFHLLYLTNSFKGKNYTVKYVIGSADSKNIQVCLLKRFGDPCEAQVSDTMRAMGYQVLMSDVVSVPGEIIVECSYI